MSIFGSIVNAIFGTAKAAGTRSQALADRRSPAAQSPRR